MKPGVFGMRSFPELANVAPICTRLHSASVNVAMRLADDRKRKEA